ncbi:sulfite exporter TauE/SafE family protein [Salininema proteolyticum]|uniref:Probable membrane transporter protein n=1 Tax=Salininema proteolyticum TaxID=1607685 RepID=A0ABV8TW03_9ACTN
MSVLEVFALLFAGLAAGVLNSIAGGGSLITYPTLIGVGVPPLWANTSNAIAVAPAYFAATYGSRKQLKGHARRVWQLVPTAAVSSAAGTWILLNTSHDVFENIVPFLVLMASLLMAVGPRIQRFVQKHTDGGQSRSHQVLLHVLVGVGCLYGSYFNAGLGLVLLAVLAMTLSEKMARIGAYKNALTAVVGVVTTVIYSIWSPIEWWAVSIIVPTALLGGWLGGHYLQKMPDKPVRVGVVVYGIVLSVVLWWF